MRSARLLTPRCEQEHDSAEIIGVHLYLHLIR